MKKFFPLVLLGLLSLSVKAQKSSITPLFEEQKVLNLKLRTSIKDIKKKTNDSTYLPTQLYVKNENGGWDSISIEVRARGIFRRANCYFTPIRIKVSKGHSKGTVLDGNKAVKLVMPCQNHDDKNTLVLKEYICYKMYEKITPYYFNTRLVALDFSEPDGKKSKNYQLTAFLIEDDGLVSKRHHAKVMEKLNLHPLALNDTSSVRHDIFQFMVGNTDWSTTFLHNAKVVFQAPKKYIPIAYDFDMSGFVDPPYAVVNADLGIANVRERLYRGFCRNEGVVQYVRKEYLGQEQAIMGILDQYEKELTPRDFADTKKFMKEFFDIFKNDKLFKKYIVDGCRNR